MTVCAGVCRQLQAAEASLHQSQSDLQSAQAEAELLQARLDAATRAKQEAEAVCLHLGEEVRKLQGQLAGTHHSMTLFQSQQLELQVVQAAPVKPRQEKKDYTFLR